jgi:hypothetical protein
VSEGGLCARSRRGQSRPELVHHRGRQPSVGKIGNREHSQLVGWDELFERMYDAASAPEISLDVCVRAASAL